MSTDTMSTTSVRDPHRGGDSYEASMLRNLLARIHRDGGHYVEEHGLDKALEDAEAKIVEWLGLQDKVGHVQTKLAQLEEDYGRACKLVADMHAAATGHPGEGPSIGVVEDVAAVRAALVLVMDYPDVRKYLGRQVADVADAALGAA